MKTDKLTTRIIGGKNIGYFGKFTGYYDVCYYFETFVLIINKQTNSITLSMDSRKIRNWQSVLQNPNFNILINLENCNVLDLKCDFSHYRNLCVTDYEYYNGEELMNLKKVIIFNGYLLVLDTNTIFIFSLNCGIVKKKLFEIEKCIDFFLKKNQFNLNYTVIPKFSPFHKNVNLYYACEYVFLIPDSKSLFDENK